jgi:hypothetical protein
MQVVVQASAAKRGQYPAGCAACKGVSALAGVRQGGWWLAAAACGRCTAVKRSAAQGAGQAVGGGSGVRA